jgi:adenylate cyclase
MSQETELIQAIEEFYLPRHLVKAIYEIGHIPAHSREGKVGVGFIDIADYTRLSRFLSPKENQILLNGLYTAFALVLERHGGFLNKIEGDSMMFHFDDILDRRLWEKEEKECENFIARELFYTCIEMQRICVLFNQADAAFLDGTDNPESRQALADSFDIIKSLRSKEDISSTLFAFFQIRIRIGANIGEVTIGNFGPSGSKHWDIIGLPVINAKRMESTAPIGGLRISSEFFDILKADGVADDYFRQFKEEAAKLGGVYRTIKWEELFRFREVILREKHNAIYKTYSVQVYPALPESLCRQSEELLLHGKPGARQIIDFIRYHRGNRYIIDSLEKMLEAKGVVFRKAEMLQIISPKLATEHAKKGNRITIYKILNYMDQYLDFVKAEPEESAETDFLSYAQYMAAAEKTTDSFFGRTKKIVMQKAWYAEIIVPRVYSSFEASVLEYQLSISESDGLSEIEEVSSAEDESDYLETDSSRQIFSVDISQ